MKKSKITGITKKAKNSVDKSESTINRFARFMGVMTKSVTKDIPNQQTLKKAGLFAKNFGGGRSSKVNKMLLGGALMLPLVLGQMISKQRSTEELLQNQYGGNEKAMQSDLNEEQKIRDEGLKKVKTTADENKDISLDRKKDLQAVSQKDPEEIPKSEVDSDATTLERMNDRLSSVDEGIDKENSDQFVELMDRFVFLAKVGAFNVDKGQGPTLSDRIDQIKANVRKFTGGKIDDGVFSLGFGINIPNIFSEKGRQKLGLGPKDSSKDQKSQIREITESVDAQITKNEKAYKDAGALAANEEDTKKYLRTKTELEKLKKRLQDEPLTVLTEMMSAANPSTVSSQSSMLGLGGGGAGGGAATFDTIVSGEGGVNSVNRGNAGDTMGGAKSIFGKDLTEMTVGEIMDAQARGEVVAVGKYQIIPPTMREFVKNSDVTRDMMFTEQTQDMFKDYVINVKRPSVGKYLRGETNDPTEAGQALAREFASVGLQYAENGNVRGSSRYAGGPGSNAASITPEEIIEALRRDRAAGSNPMGDQSSITPNKPNQIAQFVPTGYMPYNDPSKSSSQIIALTPTPVNTSQQPIVTGSGDSGSPQIIPVADHGALFSQIQLNSLALT